MSTDLDTPDTVGTTVQCLLAVLLGLAATVGPWLAALLRGTGWAP